MAVEATNNLAIVSITPSLRSAGPRDEFAVPPDADGLAALVRRFGAEAPQAVIDSMTGARFVHDRREELGWARLRGFRS